MTTLVSRMKVTNEKTFQGLKNAGDKGLFYFVNGVDDR